MEKPAVLANEAARVAVLHEHEILDTQAEDVFDVIANIAAQVAEVPIALVSLVDSDRQWFKARVGTQLQQTPREISFCAHAVAAGAPLMIPDTAADPRFADNPLVTGAAGIRFYAGLPLNSAEGLAMGTLCVLDRRPRSLNEDQFEALERLARQAEVALAQQRALVQARRASPVPAASSVPFDAAALVANAPDIITVLDPRGTILFESPAVEGLGYTQSELVGRLAFDFVHPHDHASVFTAFSRCAGAVGRLEHITFRFRHADGTWRRLESGARSIGPSQDVTAIVVHSRDVTERADEALRQQIETLENAARERGQAMVQLAAAQQRKERLSALIVHDLKSPLGAMLMNASFLLARHDLPDDVRDTINDMQASAERLSRMVRDVLDVSLAVDAKLTPRLAKVDVEALLLQVARQFRSRLLSKHKELTASLALTTPFVHGDRDMLFRLFENLIDNACRYTPEGGTIAVSGHGLPGAQLEIRISDQGPGVTPADRQRLFQPDAWSERVAPEGAGAGHGLGLVLCRLVVQTHGGSIGVDDNHPRGATFWVRLPTQGG